jgi:hypothetical protein
MMAVKAVLTGVFSPWGRDGVAVLPVSIREKLRRSVTSPPSDALHTSSCHADIRLRSFVAAPEQSKNRAPDHGA